MIRRAKCAISDKMRGDPLVRSRGRCGSSGLFLSAAARADACGAQGVGALFAAGRPGRRQSVFSARFNRRELFLAACRPERWQPEFTSGSTGVAHAQLRKKQSAIFADCFLAERTRFELVVRVHPVRRFSKPVVSATHPPLRTTFPGLCAGFPHGARRTHALSKGCANIASFRENAKKTDEISRIRPDRGPSRLLSGVSWLCGASRPTILRTPRQRVSAPVLQVEIAHVGRFCYLWLRRRYSVSA